MRLLRGVLSGLVLFAVVLVGISLVASVLFGQPAVLGYVESGSMEPTLSEGDGYVPVPPLLTGEIREGDVITYESEQVSGGEMTTHRVVAVTEHGYVTQGDANPFSDQDTGEPPITDGDVEAVALQWNGEVLRLPKLGVAVESVQNVVGGIQRFLVSTLGLSVLSGEFFLPALLFAIGVLALGVEFLLNRGKRNRVKTRSRGQFERLDTSYLIVGMAIVLMTAATVGMLAPGGTTTFEVVSAESNPDTPRVVEAGGESERAYLATNGGLLPMHVFIEPASNGVRIEDARFSLAPDEEREVTVITEAPDELGFYPRTVREYRYLGILPASVTHWLYDRHPVAPLLAVNLLIGGGTVALGFALIGKKKVRNRSVSRGGFWDLK